MKDIIIIGAGGFGREVAWLIERINQIHPTWRILGFADDTPGKLNQVIDRYKVICTVDNISMYPEAFVVCAIGNAKARRNVISRISNNFATLIDPSVIMSDRVAVHDGCIICAGSIITVNVDIGKYTIINLDCTIGHDVCLGSYITVYPSVNISGNCIIEDCVEIGTGSHVIQQKRIGAGTIIGAGSVVIKDIPANCVAVGAPAKPIKFCE